MGAKLTVNWEAMCLQFQADKAAGKVKSAKEFCEVHGLGYSNFSRKFSRAARMLKPEVRRALINEVKEEVRRENEDRTKAILNYAAPKAARRLVEGLSAQRFVQLDRESGNGEMVPDDAMRVKASTAILDRAGFNPQNVNITMQQTAQANAAVFAPFFSGADEGAIKAMLGGEEPTPQESNPA